MGKFLWECWIKVLKKGLKPSKELSISLLKLTSQECLRVVLLKNFTIENYPPNHLFFLLDFWDKFDWGPEEFIYFSKFVMIHSWRKINHFFFQKVSRFLKLEKKFLAHHLSKSSPEFWIQFDSICQFEKKILKYWIFFLQHQNVKKSRFSIY